MFLPFAQMIPIQSETNELMGNKEFIAVTLHAQIPQTKRISASNFGEDGKCFISIDLSAHLLS